MIPKYLFAVWTVVTQAAGNHLWQSSLFAVVAGLSTLMLRKHHARPRYWLWLAASMKFLIPFSLLVAVGSHLPWARGSAGTKAGLYLAMEEVSQPFTRSVMPVVSQATPQDSGVLPSRTHLLPAILATAWLGGFTFVLFVWCTRWRRISLAIREAVPLREGREVEALRRLERLGRIRRPIQMLLSRASLEPGIFGITHPIMIWPEGISRRLEGQQLTTILAHEVVHVRHRDNLAAAMHMVVEAIFWFHPLVWWLGERLADERERACDEAVLELGGERHIYAEGILKVCEFCVESRMHCVTGVTGGHLKKRIAQIMTQHVSRKLDFSRKFVLSMAGIVTVALPVMLGFVETTKISAQSRSPDTKALAPVYEVASIKLNKSGSPMRAIRATPDRLIVTNFTLHMLIRTAYGVEDDQIVGEPNWLNAEGYDVEAKMDASMADGLSKLTPDERQLQVLRMLQSLLTDRFGLGLHRETKDLPVYALVIAKNGPKFNEAKPGDTYPNGLTGPGGRPIGGGGIMEPERGKLVGQGCPLSYLVDTLSKEKAVGRTVIDKTGLAGNYDFVLRWTDESQTSSAGPQRTDSAPPLDASGPSIFTAIQEQLGLKLESQKAPLEVLVIDRAEKPSEN
jgi:bla regulator protein BlaR1